jgi:hypothetical protein
LPVKSLEWARGSVPVLISTPSGGAVAVAVVVVGTGFTGIDEAVEVGGLGAVGRAVDVVDMSMSLLMS